MFIVRVEITNSRNDDVSVYWNEADSRADADAVIAEHNADIKKWNYETVGAVSFRYISSRIFDESELQELTLDDVRGIPLKILAKILR